MTNFKDRIKNLIQKIPNPILMYLMIIIFVATWPLILVGNAIYSLFSGKTSDSKKVSIMKETLVILLIAGALVFLSMLR